MVSILYFLIDVASCIVYRLNNIVCCSCIPSSFFAVLSVRFLKRSQPLYKYIAELAGKPTDKSALETGLTPPAGSCWRLRGGPSEFARSTRYTLLHCSPIQHL